MHRALNNGVQIPHGKSVAQVMLRWHLQQGRSAIPKSIRPARIAENYDVFDFELSSDQRAAIDALDTGRAAARIRTASPWKRTARRSPSPDPPRLRDQSAGR